jgi:hypothetical protein
VQTSCVKKISQSTNLINSLQLEKKQKKAELLKKEKEDTDILQIQFDALVESLRLNEESNISIRDTHLKYSLSASVSLFVILAEILKLFINFSCLYCEM